jgi:hypothetical protein
LSPRSSIICSCLFKIFVNPQQALQIGSPLRRSSWPAFSCFPVLIMLGGRVTVAHGYPEVRVLWTASGGDRDDHGPPPQPFVEVLGDAGFDALPDLTRRSAGCIGFAETLQKQVSLVRGRH